MNSSYVFACWQQYQKWLTMSWLHNCKGLHPFCSPACKEHKTIVKICDQFTSIIYILIQVIKLSCNIESLMKCAEILIYIKVK